MAKLTKPSDDDEQKRHEQKEAQVAKPKKSRMVRNPIEEAAYFGEIYNTTEELQNPDTLLRSLAPAVVEVIAGVRNINQLAAHLSDDVYLRLRDRATSAAAHRAQAGVAAKAPKLAVGAMQRNNPRTGIVESVILVSSAARTRAVTIRLEGINNRWRATAVSVL